MHDGALISCDAGIHPGWPVNDKPDRRLDFPNRFRLILPDVAG
jgi:hypothetical protein